MRKIPTYLENPIDNVIIAVCDGMSKFFRVLKFNPNGITTLSLIFGVLSLLFLYKSKSVLAVACYFISYVFDVLDGYYARKYDMCTKFGDLYDHIKDWAVNVTYVYILFTRNRHKLSKKAWVLVLLMFVFLLGMQAVYFGAQERYYDNLDKIPSLGWLGSIVKTKSQAIKILKIVRYFGCGTFIITVMIFTVWIENKE
jgi:phosphatidylglycerophosphate synthase